MSEPKRANEHAERLRSLGNETVEGADICAAAAAEIERLAARVAELEAALKSSTFSPYCE